MNVVEGSFDFVLHGNFSAISTVPTYTNRKVMIVNKFCCNQSIRIQRCDISSQSRYLGGNRTASAFAAT